MVITFEERTLENEDNATINHCIYWQKDGFVKGEILVDCDDDTQVPYELFGKTLDALKVAVLNFVLEMCDYEYKLYADFKKFKTFENFDKCREIEEYENNLRSIK